MVAEVVIEFDMDKFRLLSLEDRRKMLADLEHEAGKECADFVREMVKAIWK